MPHGNLYTEAEVLRAITLRGKGEVPWRDVAAALGRNPNSLSHAVWRYRNGRMIGTYERAARNRERVARLFETTDLTVREIARALDLHDASVHKMLRDSGLDGETRRELRRDQASA